MRVTSPSGGGAGILPASSGGGETPHNDVRRLIFCRCSAILGVRSHKRLKLNHEKDPDLRHNVARRFSRRGHLVFSGGQASHFEEAGRPGSGLRRRRLAGIEQQGHRLLWARAGVEVEARPTRGLWQHSPSSSSCGARQESPGAFGSEDTCGDDIRKVLGFTRQGGVRHLARRKPQPDSRVGRVPEVQGKGSDLRRRAFL